MQGEIKCMYNQRPCNFLSILSLHTIVKIGVKFNCSNISANRNRQKLNKNIAEK